MLAGSTKPRRGARGPRARAPATIEAVTRNAPPDRLLAARVLREEAEREGFTRFGIAEASEAPQFERFEGWIARGLHAGMRYLDETRATRRSPRALLSGARSVVCLAAPHSPAPYTAPDGSIYARYARGADYHGSLRERAVRAVDRARRRLPGAWASRVCVDSTPIAERAFAAAAGLGWIGKNGCLIDPVQGSYLLLAEIVTDLDLPVDAPAAERCGSCVRCLEACPTGALIAPARARRLAVHRLLDHRAHGPRAGGPQDDARGPRLRLRRLPGGLPLERSPSRPRGFVRAGARASPRGGPGDGARRLAAAFRKERGQPRDAAGTPAQRRALGRGDRRPGLSPCARSRRDAFRRRASPTPRAGRSRASTAFPCKLRDRTRKETAHVPTDDALRARVPAVHGVLRVLRGLGDRAGRARPDRPAAHAREGGPARARSSGV